MKKRGKTITKVCANCGEPFEAFMIKIRSGGGKFCSRNCYMEFRDKNRVVDGNKFYKIKCIYGLTREDYLILIDACGNKCEICEKEFTVLEPPYIDHDHETGKIRGLLCNNCNVALGNFKDNKEFLLKAIRYLS